jgi:4-amino-4-deoxy-L-arabinose transferase-like glycosyltransferase
VFFVLANLVGLDRSPVMWPDEVWLNDPAKELALHGVLRSSVFAGQDGFDRAYYWQPPGQALVTALVYKAVGFGIWQTRVPVVILAAGVLVALFFLARRLVGDKLAALWAAVFLALDPKFVQSARGGRMDAQCLLLVIIGLILFLRAEDAAKEGIWLRHYGLLGLTGLFVGLGGMTHPIAVEWAIAMGCLVLFQAKRRFTSLVVVAGAAAVPALVWVLVAYFRSEISLLAEQFLSHGVGHLASGSPLQRLTTEAAQLASHYELAPFLLLTYIVAAIWLLADRSLKTETRVRVTVLLATTFLFNGFFMAKGLGFYFLHPVVVLAVCGGWFASAGFRRPVTETHPWRRRVPQGLIMLALLNAAAGGIVGRYVTLAFQWHARDYSQIENVVRTTIPPGSVVWGAAEAWYAVDGLGSSLRLLGEPDPTVDSFMIVRPGDATRFASKAKLLARCGQPLPPVFGRFRRPSADYVLEIWTWR